MCSMADRGRRTWRGMYTALVTPFRNEAVDWSAVGALVERQIVAGVDGVVPCGSTGESATLTHDEQRRMVEAVVQHVDGRCRVLAGTGSSSTADAIEMTRHADDVGADGALIVTPYYNRPSQEGLYRHYAAIAEAVDLPIVLYNVPSRCGVDLANETIVRLGKAFGHIVAVKDASGGVDRVSELVHRSDLAVLSGDDCLTLPMMTLGAVGVISVIANLVPAWMKELVDAAAEGDFRKADGFHRKACLLADAIGELGPNPVPIKTAMAVRGLLSATFRLPLCPMNEENRQAVESLVRGYEVP